MSYKFITVEQKERVALVTLNRPKQLNALNPELMQELGAALLAADADAGTGAIVGCVKRSELHASSKRLELTMARA